MKRKPTTIVKSYRPEVDLDLLRPLREFMAKKDLPSEKEAVNKILRDRLKKEGLLNQADT